MEQEQKERKKDDDRSEEKKIKRLRMSKMAVVAGVAHS